MFGWPMARRQKKTRKQVQSSSGKEQKQDYLGKTNRQAIENWTRGGDWVVLC